MPEPSAPAPKPASVVLTGAGSGIGKATAVELLRRGYRVFGSAISEAEARALQGELGDRFVPLLLDVRDEASVQAAARKVAQLTGGQRIAGLLNIAGVITNGPLADLQAQEFSNLLAVNLVGVHTMTRAFLALLGRHSALAGPPGRVINISSQSGSRTLPFTGAYGASKFGVEALSNAMRMEFRPLGIDIAVIAPGPIQTPMADAIKNHLRKAPSIALYGAPLQKFLGMTVAAMDDGIPMQRLVGVIVQALQAPRPRRRYPVHQNFLRDAVLMRLVPTAIREALIARMLALR